MKKILYTIIIVFCLFSCDKEWDNEEKIFSACGINNPKENIEWLANLIKKAETDKSGNYIGTIW